MTSIREIEVDDKFYDTITDDSNNEVLRVWKLEHSDGEIPTLHLVGRIRLD